jgi:hypothetical protein
MRTGRYNETGAIDKVVEDLAEVEKQAVAMGLTKTARPTPRKHVVRKAWKRFQQAFPVHLARDDVD